MAQVVDAWADMDEEPMPKSKTSKERRSDYMRKRKKKQGRPVTSNRVWILPEPNEELDARKLSRAFLALALHQAGEEAEAEQEHTEKSAPGDHDEPA